jgi:hypothetical protein
VIPTIDITVSRYYKSPPATIADVAAVAAFLAATTQHMPAGETRTRIGPFDVVIRVGFCGECGGAGRLFDHRGGPCDFCQGTGKQTEGVRP